MREAITRIDVSGAPWPPAAKTEGSDNKNENRAAVSRDMPAKSPAVIVTPERDEPGTSASACARPVNNVSPQVI